jgi:hypothetical protein
MSLKKFVELPAIRQAIDKAMSFPRIEGDLPMRVPPRSNRYPLIGTAYDYLLRFILERTNGAKVVSRRWVAEGALDSFLFQNNSIVLDVEGGSSSVDREASLENLNEPAREIAARIQSILDDAHQLHRQYLSDGRLNDGLIACTVKLAKLDSLLRSAQLPEEFDQVEADDIEELRQLADITPIDLFAAKGTCLLNPTFGKASRLVGGADADLYIDGSLIDIKTTIIMPNKKRDQRQLIGYAVLAHIDGIDGSSGPESEIRRIGFYASRFGQLITYPIEKVLDVSALLRLVALFNEQASALRLKVDERSPTPASGRAGHPGRTEGIAGKSPP